MARGNNKGFAPVTDLVDTEISKVPTPDVSGSKIVDEIKKKEFEKVREVFYLDPELSAIIRKGGLEIGKAKGGKSTYASELLKLALREQGLLD